MKWLLSLIPTAAALCLCECGCTSVARWWTQHVSHTSSMMEGPGPAPDPSLFSPIPVSTNRLPVDLRSQDLKFETNQQAGVLISTQGLYDPSFSNCWSCIQQSEDLCNWRIIASNYFGLPDPTNPWTLGVAGGQAGFFRAMKQVGYYQ